MKHDLQLLFSAHTFFESGRQTSTSSESPKPEAGHCSRSHSLLFAPWVCVQSCEIVERFGPALSPAEIGMHVLLKGALNKNE